MKFLLMAYPLLMPIAALAHVEEEPEVTNLAEADWLGPIVAVIIIAFAIVVARVIRRSK